MIDAANPAPNVGTGNASTAMPGEMLVSISSVCPVKLTSFE